MLNNHKSKPKTIDNIDFIINIGEHKLVISLPKQTTVQGLINIVKAYEAIHE
jgi:hypothetical protein